jgi:hypothetical protein
MLALCTDAFLQKWGCRGCSSKSLIFFERLCLFINEHLLILVNVYEKQLYSVS